MTLAALADVCQITMGQAPKGDSYNEDGDGVPLIAGAGDFGDLYPRPKKFTAQRGIRLSQPGDIVLGIRASIGSKVLADGVYCLGRGVAGLRAGPNLDGRYLWHWLDHATPELVSKGRGATFLQVNKNDIGGLEIRLPPIEEQRRISTVLDAADALRSNRRRSLAKLDTLTQAVFLDMFGSPGANPHGHEVATMIELVDRQRPITYGILKPGDDVISGVPYVRVVDMVDGSIDATSLRRTSPEISQQYKRSLLAEGDLLMSIRGHVGRLALVEGEVAGANITQDSARLAIAEANPTYVLECLRCEEMQRWMRVFTKGAAVRGINLTDVKKLPIPLPRRSEQDRFEGIVRKIRAKRAAHRESTRGLDTLFASLQQQAFRGEL